MKRKILGCLFLGTVFSISLFSQTVDLRFDLSLEDLYRLDPADLDQLSEKGVYVAIDGLLSSIYHDSEKGEIILTLLNGSWVGTEKINMYQCNVILNESEWIDNFPERIPRNPGDDIIQVNSYLLVLGTLINASVENEGVITISGLKIRDITN